MKFLIFILMAACLISCKQLPQKPTMTYANTTGVGLSHDASVETPPEVHQDKKEESAQIPPGSTVTRTETPQTEKEPAKVVTVIQLPKDKGMSLSAVTTKTDMVGSKGFTPPKGPTPTDKATAGWMWVGIGICALGIFFCTPWGGNNYRAGGLIAAGGVGMSMIGKFIDQITIPAPSAFIVFILLALAVYYGYRVHKKQTQAATTQ